MTEATQQIVTFILVLIAFMGAVSFHESAHAFAAYVLGDDTAQKAGRLSLNPLRHIDPIGLLFLILFRFGWAKPVPINPQNFEYPKFYAVLCGLAGPVSNFVFALVGLYALTYFPIAYVDEHIAWGFLLFLKYLVRINIMLGVFNLLPIPPLDGSHIIFALIPERWHKGYYIFMRYSIFILLFLLFIPQFQALLLYAIHWMTQFLIKLVV